MCNDAYEYDSSDAIQVEEEAYDTMLKGLFQLNFGANNTSSGPVITQDSNGDIRLGGLASVNGMGTCWAMSVQYMVDGKILSMIPSGAISILSFNNLKRVNSSQECIAFPESFIYNIHKSIVLLLRR